MLSKLYLAVIKLLGLPCKHDWEIVNPEEVTEGLPAIKKCKKCGEYLR